MSDNRPRRRWFQFRLRSVLLLMLAVGLWLGYEVNRVSRQQRHVATIEELGGSVEYEPNQWSLLRFYDPKKYGRTVTKAKIPGPAVAVATPHLERLRRLRRVCVVYDGTRDLHPHLDHLRRALPQADVIPAGIGKADVETIEGREVVLLLERIEQLRQRLIDKASCDNPRIRAALPELQDTHEVMLLFGSDYRLVSCRNGCPAEVVVLANHQYLDAEKPATPHSIALLLVRDRVVDWTAFGSHERTAAYHRPLLEDLDGDGRLELGIECGDGYPTFRTLPNDPRRWLDVFEIEADGFRSLFAK